MFGGRLPGVIAGDQLSEQRGWGGTVSESRIPAQHTLMPLNIDVYSYIVLLAVLLLCWIKYDHDDYSKLLRININLIKTEGCSYHL